MRNIITLSRALMPFLILMAACGPSEDLSSFQNVDPSAFNDKIREAGQRNESWANNPEESTRHLFEVPLEGSRTSSAISSKTINGESIVTFTQEGLGDDSVKGEKLILTFKKANEVWLITDIKRGYMCQDGRGHSHYSGEVCS
jgi:hypothetical protein